MSNCDVMVKHTLMENWIALTVPMMFEFTFPMAIDVIDTVEHHGTLSVKEDGTIHVDYTQEELDRSRLRIGGKIEHSNEIKTQAQPSGTIKNLKELKQPYAGFD